MEKNSKIYIAGHTGLVGSSILRKFKKEGFLNLILKTKNELDLLDQKAVNDFFMTEKLEYVIISAAKVGGIKANMTYPADFLYENLQIQNNIIWSALKNDTRKLLFLGSSCIYPRECPQPMKEEYFMDGKVEPTNEGYALAKISGIKLCEKIFEQYGKIFISCMPTNIYGENDNFNPESSHVIPALIHRMYEAKINGSSEVVIWGSGSSRREFLYVDDLADAIFWLMKNYNKKQFLNIGTGEDVSIKELALMIRDIIGYDGELIFDATKPDGMPKKLLDVSKINAAGWKHKLNLKEGLNKSYDFFKNNYTKL
jgi:GDP-L-fucose synthase